MYEHIEDKKQLASAWFTSLRDTICTAFEEIESSVGSQAKFERQQWQRSGGGGGVMSVMRGEVFEKVGVNISTVWGEFSPQFAKDIPGTDQNSSFYATGVSLVAHMRSPIVPSVHMNTRFINTQKAWFGGGADLTPSVIFNEDTDHFHNTFKQACNKFDPNYYPQFKEECDRYFYLPHRGEARGVGGIFYDYLNTNSWDKDFSFTKEVGTAFLEAFLPLVRKRMHTPWGQEEKDLQLLKRGRYVEFNLLYDRGTKFGLMTNGNTDAILMSLPPEARWS